MLYPERKIVLNGKETILDKLNVIISKVGTAIMMNLAFLICCIPIVTIGQAWSALLSAIRFQIRGDSWWEGFKFGFKTRFWRGTAAWCVMLIIDGFILWNLMYYTVPEMIGKVPVANIVASGIFFAVMAMLTSAIQILNVYVPTPVGNWLSNASAMVFKVPLQLLVCAALFWLPLLMLIFLGELFANLIMIFVVAYFMIAGLATTILLKNALMDFLVEARKEGILLAEEGRVIEKEETEETEEESE